MPSIDSRIPPSLSPIKERYHHSQLDFEKAFNRMEHLAMLTLIEAKGFCTQWLQWMKNIFSSGTSSFLLNGVPGNRKRGVRQGDPLSLCSLCLLQTFFKHLFIMPKTREGYNSQFHVNIPQTSQLFNMLMIL